jgi:hypothetical protein
LAKKIASDYYNWRMLPLQYDITYDGVVAPNLDGSVYEMIIDYNIDDCTTRLISWPWDGEPQEFFHEDGTTQQQQENTLFGRWAFALSGITGSDLGAKKLGSGNIVLCSLNKNTGVLSPQDSAHGHLCWNAGGPINAGDLLEVQCIDGIYSVLVDSCGPTGNVTGDSPPATGDTPPTDTGQFLNTEIIGISGSDRF